MKNAQPNPQAHAHNHGQQQYQQKQENLGCATETTAESASSSSSLFRIIVFRARFVGHHVHVVRRFSVLPQTRLIVVTVNTVVCCCLPHCWRCRFSLVIIVVGVTRDSCGNGWRILAFSSRFERAWPSFGLWWWCFAVFGLFLGGCG